MKQKGSLHIVIIILIVVAIFVALGFVVWKNISGEKATVSQQDTSEEATTPEPKLLQGSVDPAFQVPVTFQYPDTWKLERTLNGPVPIDETGMDSTDEKLVLKSPSGSITVTYYIFSQGGVGGTCDIDETPTVVSQNGYDNLSNFAGVSFNELIIEDTKTSTFAYDIALKRSSFSQGLKAGGKICTTTIGLSGIFSLDKGRMISTVLNISKLDSLEDDIKSRNIISDEFASAEYEQAKAILLSTKASLAAE